MLASDIEPALAGVRIRAVPNPAMCIALTYRAGLLIGFQSVSGGLNDSPRSLNCAKTACWTFPPVMQAE